MAKRYKIIKATDPKLVGVIFEYAIINDMEAPKWFTEFVTNEFRPLVKRVEAIENRLVRLDARVSNLVAKNNLVE